MKYTIETTEEGCIETITLHGKQYQKEHSKTGVGFYREEDEPFYEQMEKDGICEEVLNEVCDLFDEGNMAVDFMSLTEMFD